MSRKNPVKSGGGVSLNVILTAVVVAVAVAVLGTVLLLNRDSEGGASADGQVPASVLNPAGSATLSEAADGKVTLVEFLDYQCPACHSYYDQVLKQLAVDYDGKITFVARNFPLSMHPLAMDASRAAEAAAEQGKFDEMYHALYDNFAQWAVNPDGQSVSSDTARAKELFAGYAQGLGLDMAKFAADVDSPAVQARIDKDAADGNAAGVSSTPSLFLNGVAFEPTGKTFADVDRQLRSLIDAELAKA